LNFHYLGNGADLAVRYHVVWPMIKVMAVTTPVGGSASFGFTFFWEAKSVICNID